MAQQASPLMARTGRPPIRRNGVELPVIFDRWELALRGSASAMRNAKSRLRKGEYHAPLEALVAYDRDTGQHVLLVKMVGRDAATPRLAGSDGTGTHHSNGVEPTLLISGGIASGVGDGILDGALDFEPDGGSLGIRGSSDGLT